MVDREQSKKKFLGSLLGAALGDAVGASWEGRRMAAQGDIEITASVSEQLRYTDDTHMTIGVAESLVGCGGFDGAHMAGTFVNNYEKEPWRGYGPGPPHVFRLIKSAPLLVAVTFRNIILWFPWAWICYRNLRIETTKRRKR